MTVYISLLVLLCAVTTLGQEIRVSPKDRNNFNQNMADIFGPTTTRSTTQLFGSTTTRSTTQRIFEVINTPIPRIPTKSEKIIEKVEPCQCTRYSNCDSSSHRKAIDPCSKINSMDVCCPLSGLLDHTTTPKSKETPEWLDDTTTPKPKRNQRLLYDTTTPKPKKTRGCGVRNVGAIDISIRGAQLYQSDVFEFPWTVAIMESGNYSFSGSLIHPQVVLTAAHRVQMWQTYTVRAGEWNFKSKSERQQYQEVKVQRIINHPQYDFKSFANDFAFLILEEPFTLNDHINVICLPDQAVVPLPSTTCFANGWGMDASGDSGKFSAIMKRVPLGIVESNYCQERLRMTHLGPKFSLDPSFICAGGKHGIDTCQGDGGAPLACPIGEPSGNRYQLSGIVSWGVGCNNQLPAAYSNVALARAWIDQQMMVNGFSTSFYTALLD